MGKGIHVETMKPGTIFEHRHWLDNNNMPLLCRVTAVRCGTIYYREWVPQDETVKGSKYCFDLSESKKYIGNIIECVA